MARFVSTYSHDRYVVRPRFRKSIDGGLRSEMVPGLAAEFENNTFDSEAEQLRLRWTDEERIEVEEFLRSCADFGHRISEPDLSGITSEPRIALSDLRTCLFVVTIDGDVEPCGRPASSEDGYCDKHASLAEAPQSKPNRSKAAASS